MLTDFVDANKAKLSVMYYVSGKQRDNGSHVVQLVAQDKLEGMVSPFSFHSSYPVVDIPMDAVFPVCLFLSRQNSRKS